MKYPALQNLLNSPKNIIVTGHLNPDADAIGSSMALAKSLEKEGHQVSVIVPDQFPKFLNWMDPDSELLVFDQKSDSCKTLIEKADVLFSLDYNALHRVGEKLGKLIGEAQGYKVMIDHHQQPENFPDLTISDTSASSTAQLIYDFLVDMGKEKLIDKPIGECIYAGIMTDTGGFRFNSTSSHTHKVTAKLLNVGVKGDRIHNLINDQNSAHRLQLLGHILTNKMVVVEQYHTIYFTLSLADKAKFKFKKGDTEGFVNYGLSVNGIHCAAFFTEDEDKVKISFRSKGDFNVNKLARTHFNGGGHVNAAGGKSLLSLEETTQKFEKVLASFADQLSNPLAE